MVGAITPDKIKVNRYREEEPMQSVVHFEMPYDDRKRIGKFYKTVFGWKIQMLGEDMGNYVVATTAESDENGPKEPGRINGGFYKREPGEAMCPSFVIAVDDINRAAKKITDAGGRMVGTVMEIPGIGRYANFADTEGNQLSILQPNRQGRRVVKPKKVQARASRPVKRTRK